MGRVKTGETLGVPYLLFDSSEAGGADAFSSIRERNRSLCRLFFGATSQKEIHYTSEGQPYLERPGDFSLSHKDDFFFLCESGGEAFHLGCDIEDISQHRAWGLFHDSLTTEEKRLFHQLKARLPEALSLLLLFSWKECLLKAVGLREINLRLSELQVTVSGVHAQVSLRDRTVGEIVSWRDEGFLLSFCKLELA